MRDGVRLATDVYLPAKDGEAVEGTWPAILTRTPYNKSGMKSHAEYFAQRGYAFVSQDTRGRYASEGVWHMLSDDGPDGWDCAAWIEAQDWSDGQVGMLGTSYFGGTQHAMAMTKAPQLKTVIPVDAMSNMGYASMRNGGAFELRFWNWIYLNAARGSRQSRDPAKQALLQELADNRAEYLHNMPLRRGMTPLRIAEEYEDWLVGALEQPRDPGNSL
ncbi:MAG: CocE/NonD family hydrolase [Candidatus Hydrogenedentota bacterium]